MFLWEVCAGGRSGSEHPDALDKKTHHFSSSRALHVVPLLESLGYHIGLYCTQINPLQLPIHLLMLTNSQNVNMSSSADLEYLALLKTSYDHSGNEECCPCCVIFSAAELQIGWGKWRGDSPLRKG